jgi:hypothetical protein
MKNITSILLIAFIFMFVSTSASAVLADPITVQVTIDPAKPLPLSTVTFNATILSNETIDEVRLVVQECRVDLCFVGGFYVSMEKIANNTYQAQYKLTREEATQIKYYLNIAFNETWFTSNTTIIPLALDGKKNTTNDSHDPASTPDFESSAVIVSIAFILIFNHWIRKSNKKP